MLNESGQPIPGLFAVGSVAALTTMGSGYNSGFALGRGLTLAYLVARELTPSWTEGDKSFRTQSADALAAHFS